MTALFPYPVMTLLLFLLWLVLNQSVSPGHLLIAAACGVIGPFFLKALDVPTFAMHRPLCFARLLGRIAVDVCRSNMAVLRLVLIPKGERENGFVIIPLEMRSPYGLAFLACTLTATPGTTWVSFKEETGELLIHVLDLAEDDDWTAIIKNRYEGLLMEIFE